MNDHIRSEGLEIYDLQWWSMPEDVMDFSWCFMHLQRTKGKKIKPSRSVCQTATVQIVNARIRKAFSNRCNHCAGMFHLFWMMINESMTIIIFRNSETGEPIVSGIAQRQDTNLTNSPPCGHCWQGIPCKLNMETQPFEETNPEVIGIQKFWKNATHSMKVGISFYIKTQRIRWRKWLAPHVRSQRFWQGRKNL